MRLESIQNWGKGDFRPPAHRDSEVAEIQPVTRHNLRWFRIDGIFGQASESILVSYLTLFILALGATRAQIGWMSALSSLAAALLLLGGAALSERWGQRKAIVLLGGGGGARVVLVFLALIPLLFAGPTSVFVAIALVILRSAFIHLGVPAWTSLTADIVPLSFRGRYFSSRNIAMVIMGMATTFLVGQLITRAGAPIGYQLAMGIAFAFGLASTFSFSRIREPMAQEPQSRQRHGSHAPFLRSLRAKPDFLAFCGTAVLWNLSLGIAMPFFSVYMVENLGTSASIVGALSVISSLAAIPGQRLFGILVDRWGPRRVQLVTGLIIPVVPWGWMLARSPLHLVPAELIGGFIWAGYMLASFNFLLVLTPEDRRSSYTALYQFAATLALAGGAALGGMIATRWELGAIFFLSGLGRLAAALFFIRFVHQSDGPQITPRSRWWHRKRRLPTPT